MKLKATFDVECEAEGDAVHRARYYLELALARAQVALKDAIEQGIFGAAGGTGIRRNSTKIVVVRSEFEPPPQSS
jgi:hypothetical protein